MRTLARFVRQRVTLWEPLDERQMLWMISRLLFKLHLSTYLLRLKPFLFDVIVSI